MKENANKPTNKKKTTVLLVVLVCVLMLSAGIIILVTSLLKPPAQEVAMTALESVLTVPEFENEVAEPELVTALDERHGYELVSFSKNKSEAVAVLRVYAPDVYTCVKALPSEWDSAEEMAQAIAQSVSEAAIVEKEVELVFVKNGDEYQPVLTDEFVDAYYGGVLRLKEEYLLELAEGMTK